MRRTLWIKRRESADKIVFVQLVLGNANLESSKVVSTL